ncbi:MAG: hypothetical protein RLZZ117_1387 [Cyanobacteriota bacterium]
MLRLLTLLLTCSALLIAAPSAGQEQWIGDTKEQVQSKLSVKRQTSVGNRLVSLAQHMLGRPYRAFSLDAGSTEQLRFDLTTFDCVLLVEQLLALVHSKTTMDFTRLVKQLRYEDETVDYCHRNHYFSRWAINAERLGLIKDISQSLPGSTTRNRKLSFMSSHPDSYAPMKQQSARQCIKSLEQNLTVNQTYVPIASLPNAARHLKSGDIFALVTSVDGLDVTHTGILERTANGLNAIHAVPDSGVVRSVDFVRYAAKVEDIIGVSFFRPSSAPTINKNEANTPNPSSQRPNPSPQRSNTSPPTPSSNPSNTSATPAAIAGFPSSRRSPSGVTIQAT